MATGISFSGLGSGLDTAAIIRQLVSLERLPINALEDKSALLQQKVSAVGKLKGLVRDLQTAARELANKGAFLEYGVTASEEGFATFSATGNATAGSHTLSVQRLASADRWAFDAVTDADADLATGANQTISFDLNGTSYSLTVQQDQSSLREIASALNGLAGDEITATVVNTGTESSPSYQLVVGADDTGEDFRLSNIQSTVTGLTIDYAAPDGAGNAQSAANLTVGNNALAVIDGLLVERESNVFDGVVPSVGITATAADPAKTITFTVAADQEAIKEKLEEFVAAYNKVVAFRNEQSRYSEDDGPGGVLFGDSILQTVTSRIDAALFNVPVADVQADTEGYSTLSLVGIKKQSDGTLTINDSVLTEKLTENIDLFTDLFVDTDGFDNGGAAENTPAFYVDTTADSGLAATLDRALDRLLDATTGAGDVSIKSVFDARVDTYNADLLRYKKQIEAKEDYLERFELNLQTRFAKLEELIGSLNSQGQALAAQLSQG